MSEPYLLPVNTSFEADCAAFISTLANALARADDTIEGYSAIDYSSQVYVACSVFALETLYTITVIRANGHVQLTRGPKKRPNDQINLERNLNVHQLVEHGVLVEEH